MEAHATAYRIYALFVRSEDGQAQYFYVGKTRRLLSIRAGEHRNRARRGHEDLYVHLRRLNREGIRWECEELRFCGGSEYVQDAERFEVVRLLRLGHDLCNMRYGDASDRAELARMRDDPTIRNADDVRRARLSLESRGPTRLQVKARGRLRRKELAAMLRDTGIPSVKACALIRGVLLRRLTRHGDISVERSLLLSELVRHARDWRQWDAVEHLRRQIEMKHPLSSFKPAV